MGNDCASEFVGADAGEVLRHEAGGEDGVCVTETGGADAEQDVLLGGVGDRKGLEGVGGVESVEDLGFHCWGKWCCLPLWRWWA